LATLARLLRHCAKFVSVKRIKITLRGRIFFSMLLMIIVSFFLTGTISFYHFKQENELGRREQLRQKEYAVQQAIDFYLRNRPVAADADSIVSLFDRKICQLSSINSLDVNIYALNGQLLSRFTSWSSSTKPPNGCCIARKTTACVF
jgi:hypothetical protein